MPNSAATSSVLRSSDLRAKNDFKLSMSVSVHFRRPPAVGFGAGTRPSTINLRSEREGKLTIVATSRTE